MSSTVLVIDDEADIRLLMRLNLENAGYRVLEAGTGLEGLTALDQERPNLVLLDLQLPGMGGKDFLEHIRATGFEDLPVVIVSAHVAEGAPERMREMGYTAFLPKPFYPDDLMRVVAETLAPSP